MKDTNRPFQQRHSTLVKLAGISALMLGLLIPLRMINGVLEDRLSSRNDAVRDITSSWGKEQNIIGPILGIPYRYKTKVIKEINLLGETKSREVEEDMIGVAYFLPEILKIDGDVQTQNLHRGIYDAAVFRSKIAISGKFPAPDFASLKIDVKDVQWKDAFVSIALDDLRGVQEGLILSFGDKSFKMLPGSQVPGYISGATAGLSDGGAMNSDVAFSLDLNFNGSGGIYFAPIGVENEVTLNANWPNPAFRGTFLPIDRTLRQDGFRAAWRVSYYGRDYPQQWTSASNTSRFTAQAVENSLFGSQFLTVLDAYRHTERAIKYGVLFLVLVFTAFFLFEITARRRIHPLQYLMVGAALCLFYLLLLSASEFIGFGGAYFAAAVASTLLITWYCGSFLGNQLRSLGIAPALGSVYFFLYMTLQQQDYALLMGSLALFVMLAITMYVTRHIDWYARDKE